MNLKTILHSYDIDETSWRRIKQVYFVGLLLLVAGKTIGAPLLDAPPILREILVSSSASFDSSRQLFAAQMLGVLGFLVALLLPGRAIVLMIAALLYGLFNLMFYTAVYTREFNYLPHNENIHFFILATLALQAWQPDFFNAANARRIIVFIIGWSYFAAFITKLRNVGVDWALGETLQSSFAAFWMYSDGDLSLWFSQHPEVMPVLGVLILVFEFAALPLLFVTRLRWVTAACALLMHLGVWLTLGIGFFWSYLIAYIFMFDRLKFPRDLKGDF